MQSRFIDNLPALIDAKIARDKAYGYFNRLWYIARSKFNTTVLNRIFEAFEGDEHQHRLYVLKKAIARRKRHSFAKALKQFKQRLLKKHSHGDEKADNPEPSP